MQKLVGIEIDWSLVRACVIDQKTNKIERYEDRIVLKSARNGFVDPSDALSSIWNDLNLKSGSITVNVSIGAAIAGIVPEGGAQLQELANDFNSALAWRLTEDEAVAYIRNDYLQLLRDTFVRLNIPVDRIELAPEALKRVIKPGYSGKLTLTSGAGWNVLVEAGKIAESSTSPEVWQHPGVNVKTSNSVTEFSSVRDVDLPEDVANKYQISQSDVVICTGTALASEASGKGFLSAQITAAEVSKQRELVGATRSRNDSDVEVERVVGATFGGSKLTSLIGRFKQ